MDKRMVLIVLLLFAAGYAGADSISAGVRDEKPGEAAPPGLLDENATPVVLPPSRDTITVLAKIANRSNARKTPVAFSNRNKLQLQQEAGSRDLPLALNTCPGIHSTELGGGAGDALTTVRGFDFHNVAILINGTPVNDMENDWIYWSNWNGLADVVSSVQIQRGLGASNLAISSMGGTINILTDPASKERGFSFKQDYGSGTALRSTVTANTGLVQNKLSANLLLQRTTQNGIFDQTWADGYLYYAGLNCKVNPRHRFEAFLFGSPQQHGNNATRLPIGDYDKDFARTVMENRGYNAAKIDEALANAGDYGVTHNPGWGPLSDNDKSTLKEYYNGRVHDPDDRRPYINGKRQAGGLIMQNANYFHKPMVNFNWYWKQNPKLLLTTTAYYAHGSGGAVMYFGSAPVLRTGPFKGQVDFQSVYSDSNSHNIDPAYSTTESRARGILANWTNEHYWFGLLETAEYRLTPTSAITVGFDGRYFESELFPEVRCLLGADYYVDPTVTDTASSIKRLGDKIMYHYGGNVRWGGGFASYEQKFGDVTAIVSGSLARKGYKRRDYFAYRNGKPFELGWKDFLTGLFKAGVNYNVTPELAFYSSAGYFSKPPILEGGVFDFSQTEIENPANEKNYSTDLGTVISISPCTIKMNLYYTYWKDRTWRNELNIGNEKFIYLFRGIDARHAGIEMESEFKLHRWVSLDMSASAGDWRWMNDVTATYAPVSHPDLTQTISVYSKNLRVGNAPQASAALGLTFKPLKGSYIIGQGELYDFYYANFDPIQRQSPNDAGKQSWRIPWYYLLNFHFGYTLPFHPSGFQWEIHGHLFNALNTVYITDAQDGPSHKAWDALVKMGTPRWFNMGMKVGF